MRPNENILFVQLLLVNRLTQQTLVLLTHWGRVTQICVFTLQLCKTDDANLRLLTRDCFPCTIHLIMQYIEPVSEWSCWRMFIETWPHSELTFRHHASLIQGQVFRYSPDNAFYIFNQQIYFINWYLLDHASLI